jgi:hypothetical protein
LFIVKTWWNRLMGNGISPYIIIIFFDHDRIQATDFNPAALGQGVGDGVD